MVERSNHSLDENDIAELAELFEVLARIDSREKQRIAGETALPNQVSKGTPAVEEVSSSEPS